MAGKITDYTPIVTLPSDTYLDVSVNTTTVAESRSVSLYDLGTSLGGVFYAQDGSIDDAIRTVTLNANKIYFDKGRVGFQAVPTAEAVVVDQYLFSEPALRVLSGGSHVEALVVDEVGFVGVNGASQNSTEIFGVDGDSYLDGNLELSDNSFNVIIKSPDTTRWKIEVDNAGVLSASLA